MNPVLSFIVLLSVLSINSAVVTSPSHEPVGESTRKDKRGVFGFGAHGHHYPHYDDFPAPYHHHHLGAFGPPPPPSPPLPAPHHHVPLGAHAHTTVVKKVAVPVHVPYPVKVTVPVYKPYPVPVDRPVPVPHYVPHPVVIPPPAPHYHHHWPPHKW